MWKFGETCRCKLYVKLIRAPTAQRGVAFPPSQRFPTTKTNLTSRRPACLPLPLPQAPVYPIKSADSVGREPRELSSTGAGVIGTFCLSCVNNSIIKSDPLDDCKRLTRRAASVAKKPRFLQTPAHNPLNSARNAGSLHCACECLFLNKVIHFQDLFLVLEPLHGSWDSLWFQLSYLCSVHFNNFSSCVPMDLNHSWGCFIPLIQYSPATGYSGSKDLVSVPPGVFSTWGRKKCI